MSRHLRVRRDGAEGVDDHADTNNTNEIKDGNGIIHTTSRSLRKINYAEIESGFDFLENDDENDKTDIDSTSKRQNGDVDRLGNLQDTPDEIDDDAHEEDDDDEDEDIVSRRKYKSPLSDSTSRGTRTKRRRIDDPEGDDGSFHEDGDDEDDEDLLNTDDEKDEDYYVKSNARRRRQLEDKSFVVPDPDQDENEDENDDEDDEEEDNINYFTGSRKSVGSARRRSRRRQRSTTPPPKVARTLRRRTRSSHLDQNDDEDEKDRDSDDLLSLEDEIRELKEDSPVLEKRSLRERTKPVNYKLPPPLTETNAEEYLTRQATTSFNNPSPRRGRGGWNASQNMGPTRRLFPTGGPFGGNDVTTIFGKNTNFYNQGPSILGNGNGNNKLLLDSDSSEDEILPLGATPKPKPNGQTKKKKKPEIADLDPLGVDMDIKFNDVGGLDNYIDQLKEMVALPLLYPELYQNFDITPPRGVLFHGPPGTGKTLMARALAASCSSEGRKITFFMRKGADILSKWVGEAERQLRLLFEEAKKQQPSVIFFDEIDGLAPVRSSKQEQIHASIVSTLLALMDGMDNRGQVIVIGATNRPDAVDPALRRPGRFDREFYFPLPDLQARAQILKIHTKKWNPPLSEDFIQNLALLTKGYGGADLRALCTEAALLSIQRKFPQIYKSDEKLLVDPKQVRVNTGDFMLALNKIVPSSARSTGNIAQPLPDSVRPLLENQFKEVKMKLEEILPEEKSNYKRNSSLIQEYIEYEDYDEEDDNSGSGSGNSGFAKRELIQRIAESRVCNPKLLITGPTGNGQQYIGAAILNFFEQFNVQKLDLASLVSDSTRTLEAAVVQGFVEARKRQPSIVFIPNIDIWSRTIPETVILTLSSLFRSLKSNERVLLLGVSDFLQDSELIDGPISHLGFSRNTCYIQEPSSLQRNEYFTSIAEVLKMRPTSFKTKRKRRKPLPVLPLVKPNVSSDSFDQNGNTLSSTEALRKKLKSFQHQDMKLKNVLKIKLSGLMDLFKNRYKRFRKPPIDDAFLIHLFEPQTDPNWQPAYVKDNDMILEIATGRRFFNMDLDIIEERLWNGYYSEPKQYLKDIELIYRDANTTSDRDRIIKASEMFANAQMGIEEMSTPDFIQECKATRQRDLERQELFLRDEEARVVEERQQLDDVNEPLNGTEEVGAAAGNQLQAQLQLPLDRTSQPHDTVPEVNEGKKVDFESQQGQNSIANHVMEISNLTSSPDKHSDHPQALGDGNEGHATEITEEKNIETSDKSQKPVDGHGEPDSDDEGLNEEFVINEEVLRAIVQALEERTDGYTVSKLEELYSKVVDIAWTDRFLWDKSGTTTKILHFIDNI